MGVALFGYLVRLGLIGLAVFGRQGRRRGSSPCRSASRSSPTHLGLLLWEAPLRVRFARLPGLSPAAPSDKETASR